MRTGRADAVAAALVSLGLVLALTACSPPSPPVVQGTAPQGSAPQQQARIPAGAAQGTAVSAGGVQTISVDVSLGYFDPMVIQAKAGEPLVITFSRGQGCMSQVLMKDFGVSQDLTSGGAVVNLPAMKAGEYTFSCGMEMQFGKLVVK